MRILLVFAILIALPVSMLGQLDYISIVRQTYDQYLRNDFKNLKKTTNNALAKGIDYYYLRMRIGILSFNHQRYSESVEHFSKAICYSSMDTISREYIYYSYLFAGRRDDATLFLRSLPQEKKNANLKRLRSSGLSQVYSSFTYSSYDTVNYDINSLYYEAVTSILAANVGMEAYLTNGFKGTFAYTFLRKAGTAYSYINSSGKVMDFSQNQIYAKISTCAFLGWEVFGYGHFAIYNDMFSATQSSGKRSNGKFKTEYTGGIGITKNSWRVRGGFNLSYSNFGLSNQFRGEGYAIFLPLGNLNLYFTSGGMYQIDRNWGDTYQINGEIGFRIFKWLWFETGYVTGNTFLYARSQGLLMNNSFQIPSQTFYGNAIILLGSRIALTLSPWFAENYVYSWNTVSYTKTDRIGIDSFGGSIKLTIKSI